MKYILNISNYSDEFLISKSFWNWLNDNNLIDKNRLEFNWIEKKEDNNENYGRKNKSGV